jgi:hypothetical protein
MPGGGRPDRPRLLFRPGTKGTEMVFFKSEGHYTTSIAGTQKPDIHSPALCWALFDVYLGAKPISSDGKKTAIASFPALLQ